MINLINSPVGTVSAFLILIGVAFVLLKVKTFLMNRIE